MNLTRDRIVTTALAILDTYGLADLTMRRVAATLGVQPSALYWHFGSKQDLLAAASDTILADLPPVRAGDPTDLRLWAARCHALLRRHRDGAEVVWSALSLRPWQEGIGFALEEEMGRFGLDPAEAHAGAVGLLNLILGHAFTMDQRQQAVRLRVADPAPEDTAKVFDDTVAIFVAGLEAARPC